MAGDHRPRRLTPDPAAPRRTLDDPPPDLAPAPANVPTSEVLDSLPAQDAAAQFDQRQIRWLQLREKAMVSRRKVAAVSADPLEIRSDDPKG